MLPPPPRSTLFPYTTLFRSFCRLITGQEAPDSGEHTFGHKVATSFFSQNHADELDPSRTVLETVEAAADRKSTRLNSSHGYISYAVFCLKKKKKKKQQHDTK